MESNFAVSIRIARAMLEHGMKDDAILAVVSKAALDAAFLTFQDAPRS